MRSEEEKAFVAAAASRLRREYIPPQLYTPPQDPRALPKEPSFPVRFIQAMADLTMRKLQIFRADPTNRAALLDVITLCKALEDCGYKAIASLGRRPLVQATRYDALRRHDANTPVTTTGEDNG